MEERVREKMREIEEGKGMRNRERVRAHDRIKDTTES